MELVAGLRQFTPFRDEQKCSGFLRGKNDRPWKITWSSLRLHWCWMTAYGCCECWVSCAGRGCGCWTHVYFLLEVSRHCLTVVGSWFGLIFNASFPCLARATVLTRCRAKESTVLVMAPELSSSLELCGWVRPWLEAQISMAVTDRQWFTCMG